MSPRWFLACATLVTTLPFSRAASPLVPIETILSPTSFDLPKLSPSGTLIAARRTQQFRDLLGVVDTRSGQVSFAGDFGDARLLNYWWKGDDTMLLIVEDEEGYRSFRRLDLRTKSVGVLRQIRHRSVALVDALAADPDHVIVQSLTNVGYDLRRLDIRHDELELIEPAVGNVWHWLLDERGQAVAGFGRALHDWFVVTRPGPGAKWVRVELGHNTQPDFRPLAVHQGKLLAIDYIAGDTAAAVYWDPATKRTTPVCSFPGGDCEDVSSWADHSTKPRAVKYATDRSRLYYLDPADRKLSSDIDAVLPGTFNEVVSTSADESRLIICATRSDRPDSYWLLDRAQNTLLPLGSASASVPESELAVGRNFECTAKDGTRLTGQLFTRTDRTDGPLVVLLEGEVDERAGFEYHPGIQLFTSRGYAVATVNHRGKTGFGRSFERAGTGHIHDTMADDVAEATRWVVQHRPNADPHLVLVGQGMSGVLALHVMARNPDLYSAWVNLNTPMTARELETDEVVFGIHDAQRPAEQLGGDTKARAYLKTLDPAKLLDGVKPPSFHFYSRKLKDNSVAFGGARAERFATKRGPPTRFVLGDPMTTLRPKPPELRQLWLRQAVRAYTEVFAFLDETVPAR